jgi:hypothetical protein
MMILSDIQNEYGYIPLEVQQLVSQKTGISVADIYGVVMGYSHHEPCLRASEEWDKVRGPETEYGNAWNF